MDDIAHGRHTANAQVGKVHLVFQAGHGCLNPGAPSIYQETPCFAHRAGAFDWRHARACIGTGRTCALARASFMGSARAKVQKPDNSVAQFYAAIWSLFTL